VPVAIITGTAIECIPSLEMDVITVTTAYGETTLLRGRGENSDLLFLPRHGLKHSLPPHKINYRANIQALVDLEVRYVLAAYAVGSINRQIPPLGLVAVDDILDFTAGRQVTFYEGGVSGVRHIDMSSPFCPRLRAALLENASRHGLQIKPSGTYVCTNGPRLESPAEIRMYAQMGADVVGMTAVPELILAKERELCFAAVCFSINWAAGMDKQVQFVQNGLDDLNVHLISLFIDTLRGMEKTEQPG